MARVKVLQIITLSELGGAQKVVYHLAGGLSPEQFELSVACAPGGELVDWLKKLPGGVPVYQIPELVRNISPLNDLKACLKLYSIIRKEKFDIVHCHSSKAGILGRMAAFLARVPNIYFTVHGWGINQYQPRPARFCYTLAERLAGLVSTRVICVSNSDLARAGALRLVHPEKLAVIYNGLPAAEGREGELRRQLHINERDFVVGTVARLAPPKEILLFLETARRMTGGNRPEQGRLFFVIIGDGPLRDRCREFIKEHGLEDSVFLLGARENAPELVRDFDVFVLLSRWEGLPLTIIEAMQAGLPVVANAVGGVGELVDDRKTGILLNSPDPGAVARALSELAADRDGRLAMGKAAREKAAKLFGLEEMLRKYSDLYMDHGDGSSDPAGLIWGNHREPSP